MDTTRNQSFDLGYIVPDDSTAAALSPSGANPAPKLAEHRRGLQAAIDAATSAYKAAHPDIEGLAVHTPVSVRIRRPKGFHRVPGAILQHMLIRDRFQRTQEEILESVRQQFTEYTISKNVWTEEHRSWQLKKLRALVQQFSPSAKVGRCRTLTEFRRALQAAAAKNNGREFKTTVVVSDTQVIIAGMVLKISMAKSNGSTYRTIRPNVDKLQEALLAAAQGRTNRKE